MNECSESNNEIQFSSHMPACQADASLVVVADICDENCISLLDILHSFILVNYHNCLPY